MRNETYKALNKLFYIVALFCHFTYMGAFSEASASEILVAVAANFHNPLRTITEQFERNTGHQVQIVSGSTGKLYAQIVNGAPFELFLAADSVRPRLLEQSLNAVPGTQFTYAIGKITLWSPKLNIISEDGKSTLKKNSFSHIAIANPITAPYGRAALQTIEKLGLSKKLLPFIVQGENINQVFQFISSQNAELGFVALSQILDPKNSEKGYRWDIPDEYYDPIKQDIVILRNGRNNPGAVALWKFLRGELSKQIIKNYGYGVP